jgi:hypothetical protein
VEHHDGRLELVQWHAQPHLHAAGDTALVEAA